MQVLIQADRFVCVHIQRIQSHSKILLQYLNSMALVNFGTVFKKFHNIFGGSVLGLCYGTERLADFLVSIKIYYYYYGMTN